MDKNWDFPEVRSGLESGNNVTNSPKVQRASSLTSLSVSVVGLSGHDEDGAGEIFSKSFENFDRMMGVANSSISGDLSAHANKGEGPKVSRFKKLISLLFAKSRSIKRGGDEKSGPVKKQENTPPDNAQVRKNGIERAMGFVSGVLKLGTKNFFSNAEKMGNGRYEVTPNPRRIKGDMGAMISFKPNNGDVITARINFKNIYKLNEFKKELKLLNGDE